MSCLSSQVPTQSSVDTAGFAKYLTNFTSELCAQQRASLAHPHDGFTQLEKVYRLDKRLKSASQQTLEAVDAWKDRGGNTVNFLVIEDT
jgi:hypothetical protein